MHIFKACVCVPNSKTRNIGENPLVVLMTMTELKGGYGISMDG